MDHPACPARGVVFCALKRLPFQGPIPPIRGKCPEGTKGVGMLSAQLTERLSPNSENLRRCAPLGSPERGAVSAQPRLRGCRRSAGKDPNRKFSLRFGKEETSTEDKKPCLQGFVPSWSFLTRLRRPYLFRLAGKDRGEKGRLDAFGACCL